MSATYIDMRAPINISCPPRTVDANGLDSFDRKFLHKMICRHEPVRPLLSAAFYSTLKRDSKVAANRVLLDFHKRMKRKDLKLSMDDYDLRDWCQTKAKACARIATRREYDQDKAAEKITNMLARYGLELPVNENLFDPIPPALLRTADPKWWRRQIRTIQGRELDEFARSSRLVHRKKQIYCSDNNVHRRRDQKKRNRALLQEFEAINQEGDSYTLEELAELSVSNPFIRRSELMVRIAGFEEYAERLGYVGDFLTITCPSRFHATKLTGVPNEKYDGSTVRDSSDYLCGVWARVRAALARSGIHYFGFRVAEPHHDGSVHWHFLLFYRLGDMGDVRTICRRHALAENPGEPGAHRHRFKAVWIDKSKGSAAGYIAKYIAKNIDGFGVGQDRYGDWIDAIDSSERIEAWASVHGIRQFQQIGGPSVTVWRELRRLDANELRDDSTLEQCRHAADSANWADFCELMGSGRYQMVQLARWHEFDAETGECIDAPVNCYGEPAPARIFGVTCQGQSFITRFYRWTISRVSQLPADVLAVVVPWVGFFASIPDYVRDWLDNAPPLEWIDGVRGGSPPRLEYCQ